MSANQTIDGVLVLRELLELAWLELADNWSWAGELRALLDAPATKNWEYFHNAMESERDYWKALAQKPAAQPQGEPVAYRYKAGHASWENENPWDPTTLAHGAVLLERKALAANGTFKGDERDHYLALSVEPLYRHPPAPVAAVPINYGSLGPVERLAVCRGEQVAVVPDGYCIMPRQLTAENGAKALLLGEFKLLVTKECPECCELEEPVEVCSICDGEGEYGQQHTIPWDQIKYIYSKAVSGLAVKNESEKSR